MSNCFDASTALFGKETAMPWKTPKGKGCPSTTAGHSTARKQEASPRPIGGLRMASGLCPTPSWLPCKSAFCIASQDCCPSDGFQREREVPSQPQRDIGRMACPEQAKLDGAWGKRLGAEGWGRYFGIFLAPCFGCVGPRCTGSLHDDQHYSEPSPSTSRSRLVCCGEISHRCRLRASFPKLWERGSFLCHAAACAENVCGSVLARRTTRKIWCGSLLRVVQPMDFRFHSETPHLRLDRPCPLLRGQLFKIVPKGSFAFYVSLRTKKIVSPQPCHLVLPPPRLVATTWWKPTLADLCSKYWSGNLDRTDLPNACCCKQMPSRSLEPIRWPALCPAMLLLVSGSAIMCSLTCLLVLLSLGKPAKQFPQNLCHGGLDIMTNRGLGRKRVQSQVMSTVSLDGSWIKKLSRLRGCLLLGHPSCKLVLLRHCP